MDEDLQKKILRQLRINNIIMGAIAFSGVVVIGVMGFLVWTVVSFANDMRSRIDSIQDRTDNALDVKDDICGDNSLGNLLRNSDFCNE